jgi:hypothetical protein
MESLFIGPAMTRLWRSPDPAYPDLRRRVAKPVRQIPTTPGWSVRARGRTFRRRRAAGDPVNETIHKPDGLIKTMKVKATTLVLLVLAGCILGLASAALACPRCDTSGLVRSAVLGPAFFSQLLLVSLPFIVMGSIAAMVHRIGAKR